jgi:hypothetical protein
MTVRMVSKLDWSFWPYNIFNDYTDLHGGSGPPSGNAPGTVPYLMDNYAVIR